MSGFMNAIGSYTSLGISQGLSFFFGKAKTPYILARILYMPKLMQEFWLKLHYTT